MSDNRIKSRCFDDLNDRERLEDSLEWEGYIENKMKSDGNCQVTTGKVVSTHSTVATLANSSQSQIRPRQEMCPICNEDFLSDKMFEVPGCFHLFCHVCMKEFLRRTLVCGKIAICPIEDCKSEIQREDCAGILDPEQLRVIDQHKLENEIKVSDRVYCPDHTCSALMAKHKLLKHTKEFFFGAEQVGARKCMACGKFFCINCHFKWHYNMTCDEFQKTKTYQTSDNAKFKSAAERNGLKKCSVCNTMVERAYGCNHMICSCKYEFCYACGAEWKKKKQTCKCRLMD